MFGCPVPHLRGREAAKYERNRIIQALSRSSASTVVSAPTAQTTTTTAVTTAASLQTHSIADISANTMIEMEAAHPLGVSVATEECKTYIDIPEMLLEEELAQARYSAVRSLYIC